MLDCWRRHSFWCQSSVSIWYMLMMPSIFYLENLMCSSRLEENMTDVVEGDNVTLICNVTYYGNWEPRLEWEDVRDEWCKPQQPQCDNSSCTLTRSCTILAKDSDHDRNLSCKMTFTNESMASGDPPSFTTGCKESLNVQCKYTVDTLSFHILLSEAHDQIARNLFVCMTTSWG